MQQITLELDRDEDNRPSPTLEPEQRLIALMTQLIVAVVQVHEEEDHEEDDHEEDDHEEDDHEDDQM